MEEQIWVYCVTYLHGVIGKVRVWEIGEDYIVGGTWRIKQPRIDQYESYFSTFQEAKDHYVNYLDQKIEEHCKLLEKYSADKQNLLMKEKAFNE